MSSSQRTRSGSGFSFGFAVHVEWDSNSLIAATAQDCGLMLTLRPRHNASGTVFGGQYICEVRGPPSTHQATLIVPR